MAKIGDSILVGKGVLLSPRHPSAERMERGRTGVKQVPDMIDAYWFGVREENGLVYSNAGNEPGWCDGEERTVANSERVKMCSWGYHAADSWFHALRYASGPIACRVRLEVVDRDYDGKMVGLRRMLVAHVNVTRELRLAAADIAQHALLREREARREPDLRLWKVVDAVRRYALGEIDEKMLKGAADAAYAVADSSYAAYAAYSASVNAIFDFSYAAYSASIYDVCTYARSAADVASDEHAWQSECFNYWIEQAFVRKRGGIGD